MAFAEGDPDAHGVQDFKYNGKELDRTHGLNQYDYSARYYDPAYARFTTVDPLSEKYYSWSPYVYCLNNPIRYVDPDGRFVGTAIGGFVGGIIGGVNAYMNGKSIKVGAAEGAISGAIAGAFVDISIATGGTGGALIAAAAIGGCIGSAAGDITGQILQSTVVEGENLNVATQNINYMQTLEKGATGTVTGAVGGLVGVGAAKATNAIVTSTKGVQATMSKNITETAKTLNNMGVSQETTNKAVNKIVEGMGNVGKATNNAVQTITTTTTVTTEVATKSVPVYKLEDIKPKIQHGN